VDGEGAEHQAQLLRAAGVKAQAWQADLSDCGRVERTVEAVVRAFGGLHLAVNNAGVSGHRSPLADQPLDQWHRVIDVNLNGVFYAMK
jgi:NAD(P)-dependent dehydrogenase (short-subunit alcohol dehydrogenase family)